MGKSIFGPRCITWWRHYKVWPAALHVGCHATWNTAGRRRASVWDSHTERDVRGKMAAVWIWYNSLCLNSGSPSFGGAFEGQLRHNVAWGLSQSEGSSRCVLLFYVVGGCTATILRGLTYPKMLCTPEKEERKRENGDIAWRRSCACLPSRDEDAIRQRSVKQ